MTNIIQKKWLKLLFSLFSNHYYIILFFLLTRNTIKQPQEIEKKKCNLTEVVCGIAEEPAVV